MDFDDGLLCGVFEEEDANIQQNFKKLSLEKQQGAQKPNDCCEVKEQCCKKKKDKEQKKISMIEEQKRNQTKSQICKKCKLNKSVLLHKNDPVCEECLMKSIEYKTRLALENHLKVKGTSKILICFSGAINSICLINIISNIRQRYQKNPLFGDVECIHIQQQSSIPFDFIERFQTFTGFKLNIIPIEKVWEKEREFSDITKIFSQFKKNSNNIDLLRVMRDRLIVDFARKNGFQFILKGLNGETMATQIFKMFTKGVGGNITELYAQGPFQYPLKQHLQKQLQYYFYKKNLKAISLKAEPDDLSFTLSKQIDSHLEKFVSILQNRYSHTAPAIVRTGEKVLNNLEEGRCKWCYFHGTNEQGLCRMCQRIKQNLKDDSSFLPEWMK